MPSSNRRSVPARLVALTIIGVTFAVRLALTRRHAFNPDEFQHIHGAWCVANGLLPYRDYFEHHTPWLAFFLAPFLGLFRVETNPDAAEAFIFFSRAWMAALSGIALALTYRLGRLWKGEATAWTGTVLLGTVVMFLDKTLEVRPDVPAVAFLLGSWVAWLHACRRPDEPGGAERRFFNSGLLLGVAILCTQKVLFALPGSVLLWFLYVLEPRGERINRAKHLLAYALGALAPLAVMLAVFAAQGSLGAFLDFNLLTNLGWPVHFSPAPLLRQLFRENTLVVVLGLAELTTGMFGLFRAGGRSMGNALIPVQACGLGVGMFLMPVPYAQYLVLILPLMALLAGRFLVRGVSAALRLRGPRLRAASVGVIGLVVGASAITPIQIMAGMLRPPHTKVVDYLSGLRYVTLKSGPTDRFFDGFSGLGVFRPHAYFYFFLHDEMRALLRGRGLARLYAELRDGAVAPEWVVMDDDVRALPPEIVAFFEANYKPAEVSPLWRLKDVWLDAGRSLDFGSGPTDVLAGRGWSGAEQASGRTFRLATGRRSSVRLPIRRPAGCRAMAVRGGLERAGDEARMELSINRVSIGVAPLSEGWHDYLLPLPRGVLRSGVNALRFSWEGSANRPPPDSGRGSFFAMDELKLDCESSQEVSFPGRRPHAALPTSKSNPRGSPSDPARH